MGYFSTDTGFRFGQTITKDDEDSAKEILSRLDAQDEERKKQEEEQAAQKAQASKSTFQKVKDYLVSEASFAMKNPVTAAKTVGETFYSGIKASVQDISAPFTASIYNKANEEMFKKQQETDSKLLEAIKKETDPEKKKKLVSILNQKDSSYIDVMKEVPALNKTPGQIYADFAGMGLDMLGFATLGGGFVKDASGKLIKSGVRGFGAELGVTATKETGYKIASEELVKKTFMKTVVDGAGWGAAYGGIGAAQQGEGVKGIAKGAVIGGAFGGALAAAGGGISKGITALRERPMNKIKAGLVDEYEKHVIDGVTDHKLATELLDNAGKSVKMTSDIRESLSNVGVDLEKNIDRMATEEGQRALAGQTVVSKMSRESKNTLFNEIKESGLFKIEKGDTKDSIIEKAVSSVLGNGKNVRDKLKFTSQYTDSVLGVVNPKLAEVDQTVAQISAAKATRPQHQVDFENALNSGNKAEIKKAFDSIPEGDPYKESMRGLLPDDMRTKAPESKFAPMKEEPAAKVEPTVTPKETPKAEVKPEEKVTKAARDINTKLAQKGIDQLPEEELAKYSSTTVKKQVENVSDLMTKDIEKAKNMALGKEPVTGDVNPQVLFNAVSNHAEEKGDYELLRSLASSPIATQESQAAQTLRLSQVGKSTNNPVMAMKDIADSRAKAFEGKAETTVNKVTTKELKNTIQTVKSEHIKGSKQWSNLVESLRCK